MTIYEYTRESWETASIIERAGVVTIYLDLITAVGWAGRDEQTFARALGESLWTGIACDEYPRGAARLVGDGAFAVVLYDLVVHPEAQRRGIAGALVSAALAFCRAREVAALECIADPKAALFYRATGWVPVEGFRLLAA